MRFTDKTKIERVRKKQERSGHEATRTNDVPLEAEDSGIKPPSKIRQLRPRQSDQHSVQPRVRHILPVQCIICRKDKTTCDHFTRKRRKEKLTQCETISAGKLVLAAEMRTDEKILMQIRGKDPVALEVRYHLSCYQNYTRFLTKKDKEENSENILYKKSYDHFCRSVVDVRVVKGREVLRLQKLLGLFKKCVKEVEGKEIPSYKSFNLKRRLQKTFPFLKFLRSSHSNASDLVFVEDLSMDEVAEDVVHPFSSDISSTDETDGDTDSDIHQTEGAPQVRTSCDLRPLYHAAQSLRRAIERGSNSIPQPPWPPTARDLTADVALGLVPDALYNFMAWTVGATNELPPDNSRVQVKDAKKSKIVSICQDVMNLASSGRTIMPKHSALAMSVRHLTGSAQLIGLLNGLGHCSSNSQVLEHDTALAQLQIQRGENFIPPNILPSVHTTLVWDNNDFGEETLSGKGTTHNTNGIILQRPSPATTHRTESISVERTRKRSIQPPAANIDYYSGGQRRGPFIEQDVAVDLEDHIHIQQSSRRLDSAYYFTKVSNVHALPGWSGFNTLLQRCDIPPLTNIGYLPVIDASPTNLNTVYTILCRSVAIADQLGLNRIVVVFDQAIYAKAQEIRWRNDMFRDRLVIRMGEFHTAMAYLACIGKRFGDAGFQDIVIESEVVAAGSLRGVISGHHYNRSLRTHKLVCEALHRLCWQAFFDTLSEEDQAQSQKIVSDMQAAFPSQDFDYYIDSEAYQNLSTSYDNFIIENKNNETFQFWCSYMEMVGDLLQFIRATRQGDWNLHLFCVRSMLPWYFSYDRVNYARYLSAYWVEMCALKETHPDIHDALRAGNFVAQRQQNHGFAQVACDQVIEQTANRDSKTKGGLTGFTLNKGAVYRWTLSQHERAAITRECQEMAGRNTSTRQRIDLDRSRIDRDERDIQNIMDTILNMVNPFDASLEREQLYNITSGQMAPKPVLQDLKGAKEKGEEALMSFCQDRLLKQDVGFHDTLKRNKLKTFKDAAKSSITRVKGREIALKADRNLFARLIVVGTVRKIDIGEMLVHTLGPLPAPLANHDGSLVKTNKAKLLHFLEGSVKPSPTIEDIPFGSTWVWDAMALIRSIKPPSTFGQFADQVLKILVKQAKMNKSKIVHFVPDRYKSKSIKNAERGRRAVEGSQLTKIFSGDQKIPNQWTKFLSSGENKENLLQYLFERWSQSGKDIIDDVTVIVGHGEECHAIRMDRSKGELEIQPLPALFSTQEEADTRLLLHSLHAASCSVDVIINSPDTDVFILCLAFSQDIDANMYFRTGQGNKTRTIAIGNVFNHFGQDVCRALIGLHCFTGCDTVSAMYGIGKVRALKLMMSSKEHCTTFQNLGASFSVPLTLYEGIEAYTCELYGQKGCKDVNDARCKLFKSGTCGEKSLPTNKDSLHKHTQRANYQAAVHKLCLDPKPETPSPESHGWKVEDDAYVIDWMTLPPAPASVLELSHCSCKKTQCTQGRCSCLQNNMPCTDMCSCIDCANLPSMSNRVGDDDDDDDDSDEELEAVI
eukprot:XP_011673963.1 PREDICTED: uncharacterized protein LOC105442958 [Strongylocentrotus purpuratus]